MNNWINALRHTDLLKQVDSDADLQALAELAKGTSEAADWFDSSICLDSLPAPVADIVNISIGQISEAVTAWHEQQIEEWDQESADRARETEQQRLDATLNARAYLRSVM